MKFNLREKDNHEVEAMTEYSRKVRNRVKGVLKVILYISILTFILYVASNIRTWTPTTDEQEIDIDEEFDPDFPDPRDISEPYYEDGRFYPPYWWYLDEDGRDTTVIYGPYLRSRIGTEVTWVACWPSTGGFWEASVGPVELDFLNLPRFHNAHPSKDAEEEDQFCTQLRKLGPVWYPNVAWYRYSIHHNENAIDCSEYRGCCMNPYLCPQPTKLSPPVYYAYPSTGGVWVLALINKREESREGMGKIKNAYSMNERAMAIEMMGGVFYADPDQYWAKQVEQVQVPVPVPVSVQNEL